VTQRLERRIQELEQQLAAAPAAAPGGGPTSVFQGLPTAASAAWGQASAPATAAVPAQVIEARPPSLSLAEIERSVHVDIDPALDGRRRRRRNVVVATLFFLLVFGGLFGMLAQSYAPHP